MRFSPTHTIAAAAIEIGGPPIDIRLDPSGDHDEQCAART